MELQEIVGKYAAAIQSIDSSVDIVRANPRTGEIYLPGVKSFPEAALVNAIDDWWVHNYKNDLPGTKAQRIGVPYPELARTKCDHIIPNVDDLPNEWAIEVKNISLIGNNGKRNDFAVAKILSPFLKDRSLLHDVVRLRTYDLAKRHAVIGYSFEYNSNSCETARELHPQHLMEIANIEEVCVTNGGDMTIDPLLEFADGIMRVRGLITGSMCVQAFSAWRHPCGGVGKVFGWEVRRPEKNAGFDPRHPW